MSADHSVAFFDRQFERQLREGERELNPFERAALPHLRGRVLDFGCGLGNLALAAARAGHTVLAFDASAPAIDALQALAEREGLPLRARVADLRRETPGERFDTVVAIGLLMFFDCPTARRVLGELQCCVEPGGVAIVNLLVEGTTYLEMFDPAEHCLFARGELASRFAGWELLDHEHSTYPAPDGQVKAFDTVIARRPRE